MSRRRPYLLLPLLALACVASACGSGGALSLDPVAAAATKTVDAKTFRVDFTASIQAGGHSVSFSGSGAVDTAAGTSSLTMDLSGLPGAGGGTMNMIFTDKTMYLQAPFLAALLPSGRAWVSVDLAKVAAMRGVDLGSFSSADPASGLAQLQAVADVTKVGDETVQGETMTHYHAVVDIAKAAGSRLTDAQKTAIRRALRGSKATVPVDVWVDSDGRVRRETLHLDAAATKTTMTLNLSAFGEPVTVMAPGADQVVDLTSLVDKKH